MSFLDRTLLPHVAFDLSDPTNVASKLTHLRRVTGIASYGQGRLQSFCMGHPPCKPIRYLAWYAGRNAKVDFLAIHQMNTADAPRREQFIERVETYFRG